MQPTCAHEDLAQESPAAGAGATIDAGLPWPGRGCRYKKLSRCRDPEGRQGQRMHPMSMLDSESLVSEEKVLGLLASSASKTRCRRAWIQSARPRSAEPMGSMQ